MERFRKIKFQNLVLLYSLCLIAVFILAAVLFITNIEIHVPDQMQGYYVSVNGMQVTKKGIIIPLNEIEHRIITKQEIHLLITPYYVSIIVRTTLIAFSFSLILSFIFAHILTKRIIKPIEETADSLRNFNGKSNGFRISFPKELSDIEAVFREIQTEISCLYADFENLSSFISHEQKNSLALLRAMLQNGNSALEEKNIAQIDRMVKNLDDILALSANESRLEKIDLSLVCGMAVDEYKRIYPDIYFDFDEDTVLYVNGHELLVYRAISNLIDNAIKYGKGKPIMVYAGMQKNCPYISVEDHGIGIKMEQQEKIFENRYRIGNRQKNGYGIGLSLVRHVAELCGGFVWVESEEAKGSKFKLIFPAFTMD